MLPLLRSPYNKITLVGTVSWSIFVVIMCNRNSDFIYRAIYAV
jgi:hypothetical protein